MTIQCKKQLERKKCWQCTLKNVYFSCILAQLGIGIEQTNAGIGIHNFSLVPDRKNAGLHQLDPVPAHTHMHMHTHGHRQTAWSWTCIIGMVMDKDHECQHADEMFSPASLVLLVYNT
jgi:hypothetical protein